MIENTIKFYFIGFYLGFRNYFANFDQANKEKPKLRMGDANSSFKWVCL